MPALTSRSLAMYFFVYPCVPTEDNSRNTTTMDLKQKPPKRSSLCPLYLLTLQQQLQYKLLDNRWRMRKQPGIEYVDSTETCSSS